MMHGDRRLLLKSLAATGLTLSGAGWMSWAQASAPATPAAAATAASATALSAAGAEHVLALTSALSGSNAHAALDSAFIAGVRASASNTASAATSHQVLRGLDSATFQQLGQLLSDDRSTLLVGWLDDASATLVLDLVRSAGGRVLSEHPQRVHEGDTAQAHALGQALALGQPAPAAPAPTGAPARVALRCLI